jgi:hypothetical protein
MSKVGRHMKRSFVSSILVVSLQSMASELNWCESSERTIFSCRVRGNKVVSVCAGENSGTGSPYLQYRFGVPGAVPELVFPAVAADGPKLIRFTSFGAAKWSSRNLLFEVGQYSYLINSYSGVYDEREASITVRRVGASCSVQLCRPGFVDNFQPALHQMQLREAPRELLEEPCRARGG